MATEAQKVIELLRRVREEDSETSVDIETRGKGSTLITSIALTINAPHRAFAIPLGGSYFSRENEQRIWEELKRTLHTVPIIGQNFLFDWDILWNYGIWNMHMQWDTMVAQHLLFTDFPRSLEAMVSMYTDRQPHKYMMGEDLYLYNAFDVVTTYEVYLEQRKRFTEQELEYMSYLMRLHKPLIQMQKRGILVDFSYKDEALADMRAEQSGYEAKIDEVADRPLKPRSSPDLQNYYYEEQKEKPFYNKKTGRPRVDKDALQRLVQRGYESAHWILKAREVSKLASTYFNMTIDNDNRLRCQIKPTGTVTGRLATSATAKGTGGNLQNIPPKFGYCLCADPGYILIEADLEQAEKRLVALITGDDADIDDFKNGVDVHTRQAAIVLGKDEKDVTKEERNSIGKPLNHATSYDVGPYTFAQTAGISNTRGKEILEAYHKRHPQLKKHFEGIRKHLKQDNTLYNLFGRPRRFYGIRDSNLYRSAYDYCPQSTTGDICNRALVTLYNEAPHWLLLLMQIHDSILVEVPDDIESVVAGCQWLNYALYHYLEHNGRSLDIPVEFKIGYRWNKKVMPEFKGSSRAAIEQAYKEVQREGGNDKM